jgi:hypothetical protein
VDAVEAPRIIVAVAAEGIQPAVGARQLVPFFASHLAGFAADAHGGVRVKSHWLSHSKSPFLATSPIVFVYRVRDFDA